MKNVTGHILIIATVAQVISGNMLAYADQMTQMPSISLVTIADIGGLDERTLYLAALTPQQRTQLTEYLKKFFEGERIRLSTYRAIWCEAIERLGNLEASVAENSFDPCLFVTDAAVEKARSVVQNAKDKFEQQCRTVTDGIGTFLDQGQSTLIKNARDNRGLPEPYRWLSLDEPCRTQIKRFIQLHQARLELVRKYPDLKKEVSQEQLENQIGAILTQNQLTDLKELRAKLQGAELTVTQPEDKK